MRSNSKMCSILAFIFLLLTFKNYFIITSYALVIEYLVEIKGIQNFHGSISNGIYFGTIANLVWHFPEPEITAAKVIQTKQTVFD